MLCMEAAMSDGKWLMKAQLRRENREVRAEAEAIDGNTYYFTKGWVIESDDSRYPGETAFIPHPDDINYPKDAPTWIASGDLVPGVAFAGKGLI